MATRKYNKKNNKSNKRFRKTRSKKQRGGGNIPSSTKRTHEDDNMTLYQASHDGDTETVAMLLEKGADVNALFYIGNTALIRASMDGHTETVTMLLDAGADVNVKNNGGATALIWASQKGHTEIVAMLLDEGADMNVMDVDGRTALISASEYGHTKIVKMLLDEGADMNEKDMWGDTPLIKAIENGHTEIVAMLKVAMKSKPPPCMSQTEYEKCIPGWDDPKKKKSKGWPGDAKPTCGISLENIERKEDAVKLPGQPKVCYDRKTLNQWFNNSKTNPQSRESVEDDWIDANMGDQDCEPQIEEALPTPPTTRKRKTTTSSLPPPPPSRINARIQTNRGGKRKTKRKSKKPKKSKRKSRKTRT